MKEYKNFDELERAEPEVFRHVYSTFTDEMPDESPAGVSFEEIFGGSVFEVESVDDLAQINTTKLSSDEARWANLLEAADAFEECRWLADGTHVVLFTTTNNSGGPTYFIPKEVAETCPNVIESIERTDQFWAAEDREIEEEEEDEDLVWEDEGEGDTSEEEP